MNHKAVSKKLFNLLTVRDYDDLQALDSKTGKPAVNNQGQPDITAADLFSFDWKAESGKNYGTAVITLDENGVLNIYFGDNLGRMMDEEDKDQWYEFLYQLKQFAAKNFYNFRTENLNKLKYNLAGQAAIKEGLFESWFGNRTTSWNAKDTEARLMIRHRRALSEHDPRHLHIDKIFIETADGERFRMPFRSLRAAKAMLEHVRHGGTPYDVRGQHIISIVEDLTVLSRFARANRGRVFEGQKGSLVEQAQQYRENLNRVLGSLAKHRGYTAYFETWNPSEITGGEVAVDGLREMFLEEYIDARVETALPVLAKIHKESAMKEATIFENWAMQLSEGTWALPDTPEKKQQLVDLMSREFPVGADAIESTEELYNLFGDDDLFDKLSDLAEFDADADARDTIKGRLEEVSAYNSDVAEVWSMIKKNETGKPNSDNTDKLSESASAESIAMMIYHRLERQHPEMLERFDSSTIDDAIQDTASFYGQAGLEEIGSSDLSGMVRSVIRSLENRDDVNEVAIPVLARLAGIAASSAFDGDDDTAESRREDKKDILFGGDEVMEMDDTDEQDPPTLYYYINDYGNSWIARIEFDGRRYREEVEAGNAPSNFGGKTYMSYLTPQDIKGWMDRDYDRVEFVPEHLLPQYLERMESEQTVDDDDDVLEQFVGMREESDYDMSEGKSCNMTAEGEMCPEHGLSECGMTEADNLATFVEEDDITGMCETHDYDHSPESAKDNYRDELEHIKHLSRY